MITKPFCITFGYILREQVKWLFTTNVNHYTRKATDVYHTQNNIFCVILTSDYSSIFSRSKMK